MTAYKIYFTDQAKTTVSPFFSIEDAEEFADRYVKAIEIVSGEICEYEIKEI